MQTINEFIKLIKTVQQYIEQRAEEQKIFEQTQQNKME